jgi:hypothetical protein
MAGITLAIGIRDARFVACRAVIGAKDVAYTFRSSTHPSADLRASRVV